MFGCESPEQGQVFALAILCENMTPIEIAKKYHIIQGRLTKRADAMLAEFREAGGKHRVLERTSDVAEIELLKDGESNRFRFTFAEAQQEKFPFGKDGKTLKDNWATPRGRMQMLWARVVSDGIRCVAPEVVAGTYTPEEMKDVDVDERRSLPAGSVTIAPMGMPGDAAVPAGGEVIDAEFQHVVETAAAEASAVQPITDFERDMADVNRPSTEPQEKVNIGQEIFAEPTNGDGFATAAHLADIRELIMLTKMPYEAQEAAMKKRRIQAWRNMTVEQAEEFIAALRSRLPS
jgi:hypothetical protein